MNALVGLNQAIFFWINRDGGNHYAWLDTLMIFFSSGRNGVVPIALVAIFAFWRSGKAAWRVLAALAALLLLSDWGGGVIKHWIALERPCDALEGVRLLVPDCGRNSFPSNHAMNMAAAATYLGWHYRLLIVPMVLLALMVGISRIYVGVHYPADVLFGWMLGTGFASLYYWTGWRYLPEIYQQRMKRAEKNESGKQD